MDLLLAPMAILVELPILAAAIGLVLLGLGWRIRRRIAVGVGVLWILYAFYELGMKRRWLCSGECNIRVDLLLIYPLLLVGLVAAAISLFRTRPETRPPAARPE
jgi:hypothetical protein